MNNLSLKEHIKRSKQAVAANKAKGNRHAEILTGLYSKPARFIDEIIQNSEDAYRQRKNPTAHCSIRFELFEDRIEVFHNGKDFDEEDLKSITTFANTTKDGKDEVNLIGKFGIGFKSVFAITDEPHIFSAQYSYKIVDYEILEKVKRKHFSDEFGTIIVLPFKKNDKKNIFKIVKHGLDEINAYSLLFLTEINKIEIKIFNQKNSSFIEKTVEKISDNIKISNIRYSTKSKPDDSFLVLFKNKSDSKIDIELAFKLKNGKNSKVVEPLMNSKLFVYFPTQHDSYLNFLVHASFTTTPTREFVPFDKFRAGENLKLIKETADFFASMLTKIRDLGFLDLNFFKILPIAEIPKDALTLEEHPVYKAFYDVVLEKFSTKKLLPALNNNFTYAKDSAFAENLEIIELLNKNDIEFLFAKKSWISDNITNDESQELKIYLESKLKITKIDFKKFTFQIAVKPKFLQNKNEKWFIRFYSLLASQKYLWDKENKEHYYSLRNKEFILLNDKSLSAPFDENESPLVYLPGKFRSKYKIVKRSIAKNESVLSFFTELGLSEPDLSAEVIEFVLPKYNNENLNIHTKEYKSDLLKIISVHKANPSESFLKKLRNIPFLESYNPVTNKIKFIEPEKIYFPTKAQYIHENEKLFLVSKRIYKNLAKTSEDFILLEMFLKDVGVKVFERETEITKQIPESQRKILDFLESKNISFQDLEKRFSAKEKNTSNLSWKPEIEAEETKVKFIDFINPDNSFTGQKQLSEPGLSDIQNIFEASKMAFPDFNSQENFPDVETMKKVGEWAEKFVYKALLENEYASQKNIEIIKSNSQEAGYSFKIKQNENLLKIIAVLAKGRFDDNFFIYNNKWKISKQYFDENAGNKYYFYCVSNAGSKNATITKIQNPYKAWKESELNCKLISFKLK